MKVLVACEFSGIVRDAFARRGHDAWSCDLLPTEIRGKHIRGDVFNILYDWSLGWDLMIAHPPCTYLVNRAASWRHKPNYGVNRLDAQIFFMKLINAPIKKIAVENPVGCMSTLFRKPNQYIQPYQFGHPQRKRTGLWLKGLPPLFATALVEPEKPAFIDRGGHKRYFVDNLPPSQDRWKIRSRTFSGIAEAMAEQWG